MKLSFDDDWSLRKKRIIENTDEHCLESAKAWNEK